MYTKETKMTVHEPLQEKKETIVSIKFNLVKARFFQQTIASI